MKKFVKLTALLLTLVMVLSGCGASETVDSSEQVELTWVFGGPGELEDSERVWKAFNEKLQEYLPNTTVKFKVIPTSSYAENMQLMNAANEDMDIVWVCWSQNFADEVDKGAYMDITELVEKYGQDMTSEFPEWLLDLTTINNKIYAIPNYQMMASPVGILLDAEHVEKGWFDIAKAEEILCGGKVLGKDDYKIFEDYLTTVLNSGEQRKYVSSDFLKRVIKERIGMPNGGIEPIICNAAITKIGDDYKVYNTLTDFPQNYEYYDVVSDWYNKGIIRKDILENPTEVEGDYLLGWTSVFKGSEERATIKFKRPMKICSTVKQLYVGYNGSSTNTAISSNSKHPERAMQLLNLMNSSKGAELLNLLSYGFEGEHYKKVSEDRIEWLGEETPGSSKNKYGYYNWALGNALVTYTTQSDPDGWNEYIDKDINKNAEISRLAGFSLDMVPISREIAQYNAVIKEYEYLDKGTTPEYKELLEERNAKLREAGSDKIVEEVQRQIDEWVKNTK